MKRLALCYTRLCIYSLIEALRKGIPLVALFSWMQMVQTLSRLGKTMVLGMPAIKSMALPFGMPCSV